MPRLSPRQNYAKAVVAVRLLHSRNCGGLRIRVLLFRISIQDQEPNGDQKPKRTQKSSNHKMTEQTQKGISGGGKVVSCCVDP